MFLITLKVTTEAGSDNKKVDHPNLPFL